VTLEAPDSGLLEDADELEPVDEAGIWAPAPLEISSGWTAIITQTCDVVRALNEVTHLQLMPIVELSEQDWNEAIYGRPGTLFSLPAATGMNLPFPAIDCAISFPVSKAALARQEVRTLLTPLDPASRILLSHWLMRRVGRYAFPDQLEQHVLGQLREKVSRNIGKTSQRGLLASATIGVRSSTVWTAGISIYFIVDENQLRKHGVDIDLNKAATELLAPSRKALGAATLTVQITRTVRTLERVGLRPYGLPPPSRLRRSPQRRLRRQGHDRRASHCFITRRRLLTSTEARQTKHRHDQHQTAPPARLWQESCGKMCPIRPRTRTDLQ
jgi:hypothetical protein